MNTSVEAIFIRAEQARRQQILDMAVRNVAIWNLPHTIFLPHWRRSLLKIAQDGAIHPLGLANIRREFARLSADPDASLSEPGVFR